MIFIERAALEQQPACTVEDEHREGAMKDTLAVGAHFVDHADLPIGLVDANEHRSGGHRPLIHPLRLSRHVMDRTLILFKQ